MSRSNFEKGTKVCSGCKIEQSIVNFYKRKCYKDGFEYECISCCRKKSLEHYYKNQIREQKRAKQYRLDHLEQHNKTLKEWRATNQQHIRDYDRKYRIQKESQDIVYKIRKILRIRLNKALKNNQKVGSAVRDLGCSIEELKLWLEQQFQLGMLWNNYGHGMGKWSIDHIIPLAKVDLQDPKQFKKVNHWFNLRPIWFKENSSRGNKI